MTCGGGCLGSKRTMELSTLGGGLKLFFPTCGGNELGMKRVFVSDTKPFAEGNRRVQ